MKTIAQQLNIKSFPFEIRDTNGNHIYYEDSKGYWYKSEYNANSKEVYFENSRGYWVKNEYDTNGNKVYCESSDGKWIKREYDTNNKVVYCEYSNGVIEDNRPKPMKEFSMDEIAAKFGIPVDQLKIKK